MADEDDSKQVPETEETPENEEESDDVNFSNGQLSYLGHDAEEFPSALIAEYAKSTQRLDLSYNRLHSLNGIEEFTNLEELVLDNNCLGDDVHFPKLDKLHTLTLNKNSITNLDNLLDNLVSNLPSLRYLSLLGNVACPNQLSCIDKDEDDYKRYRFYVLFRLSNLKFLDSTNVKSSELQEAKRVGPYMKVVKATSDSQQESEKENKDAAYTPLPDVSRKTDEHIGSYGKSKYVYYGRHSEGNRFIKNTDL